jgi:hypothetical protein
MELESLKYIWHSLGPAAREPDHSALLALLEKRSRGPVARMRRNLVGEGILLLVTYIPGILCYFLEFEGRLSAISWLLVLLALVFFGYYSRKYRLLKEMHCVTAPIRSSLAQQVKTLKKYTRFYLRAGTGLIPGTYLVSYAIIRWKLPAAGSQFYHRLHPISWWASPLFWLILLVPLTIGIYFINAWYINKLYGQHIKKLQELLQELDME